MTATSEALNSPPRDRRDCALDIAIRALAAIARPSSPDRERQIAAMALADIIELRRQP
jgi:hypothetical protein